MQDLDIRGAGNLLGAEQSGSSPTSATRAYQQILRESITELKTEEFADTFADVSDGTDSDEFVATWSSRRHRTASPSGYVPRENGRIMLYAGSTTWNVPSRWRIPRTAARPVQAIPDTTEQLIRTVPLRMAAKRLGIERAGAARRRIEQCN